jgi:phosphoglycerate dehydrogenase-like enzyme
MTTNATRDRLPTGQIWSPRPRPYFLPNVLATPHIGYVTEATYASAFQQIVENIAAWLDGKPQRVIGKSF